jgi:hypothetical protein
MAPENETDFKLKFDGRLNEVDASTLGYSLVNITTIIREISEETAAGKIDIKVKSTAPGSFLVHLALGPLSDPLFQANLVQAGEAGLVILKTLTELFRLRKLLKGEPPKEINPKEDEIEVKTGNNSTVIIDKRTFNTYFNHPIVNEALAKTFKALESDPSIEGFEITDEQEHSLFEATRDDFPGMGLTTSVPQTDSREVVEPTHVYIVKPSFDPKLKWDVLYKGNRIPVWMRDQEFQGRIEKGERFAKGDVLAIELKIHQKLDTALGAYVNKSYEIIRVREHIPRLEQNKLFVETPTLLMTSGKRKFALGAYEAPDESETPPEPEPKISN